MFNRHVIAQKTALKNNQGFTLLELLIVVSILSSIAYMAVDNVAESDSFNKWQRSQYRLDNMRQAIIGNSRRELNGRSELSGFVVDMGRLPHCVRELLEAKSCDGTSDLPAFRLYEEQVAGGWRGPYLNATHRLGDYDAYRDGWGNKGASDDIPDLEGANYDSQNFGWLFQSSATATGIVLTVQTLGGDGITDEKSLSSAAVTSYEQLTDYEKDYPKPDSQPLISSSEYQILITSYSATAPITYMGGVVSLDLSVKVDCIASPLEAICASVKVDYDSEGKEFRYLEACLGISTIADGKLDKYRLGSHLVKVMMNATEQSFNNLKFGKKEDTYLTVGRHYATLLKWNKKNKKNKGNEGCSFDPIVMNNDSAIKIPLNIPFTVVGHNHQVTLQGVVK